MKDAAGKEQGRTSRFHLEGYNSDISAGFWSDLFKICARQVCLEWSALCLRASFGI